MKQTNSKLANTNQTAFNQTIPLILGSSGKTGRRVVKRFVEKGLNFRACTRHSEIPFDWYDASTWDKAIQGVSAVYVVFSPDLAVPKAPAIIKNFVTVAKSCGVEHLVLLSGRGEAEAQSCEKIVMDSTLDWTIVRSSWFAQNFSEGFMLDDILRGQVLLPVDEIKEPFVDVDDIADIVFAALTDDKHNGQIYEVTGSKLLSFREAVAEIAIAANRKIDYQQVPMDDYVKYMIEANVPRDYIELIKYLFTEVLDGRNSSLTDGVKRALGHEASSFHCYANAVEKTGIWDVVEQAQVNA